MHELYRDGYDYLAARPDVTAALLVGGLVLGALALLAAHLFRWGRTASVLAGVSLALALSVTLVRPFWGGLRLDDPLQVCVPGSFSLAAGGALLNFVMLMPLGFFGVLATKRPLLVAIGCVSVSAGIEIAQAVFELGVCDGQDFMNNSVGGALATVAGWLLLLAFGRGRHQRRHEMPSIPVQFTPRRETAPVCQEQQTVPIGAWHRR
ncbi:VanZ family protein [Kutzneria sp. CA-103260]|uniref:VanZ family protein n=1 Tax=Kutzneria sp. CA-103260 TaxID=2802641 RepID=UPI001BAD1B44|nr:VanZ family protein [Kutzneria sp. CA-103260]QUQ69637.1 VanZ like family protein [Kutzneria sp. CA-103260]